MSIVTLRPKLPGTLEGLVEFATQAMAVVGNQDDVVADLTGLLARIERHLEGQGGDPFVLLLDTRDALRMADIVRDATRPWLARVGVR
ncbi:MAG: hypothetical protein AB7R89_06100 [Dehalococcoidia bacterium]